MNILIYIILGFVAILLTIQEGIKWHIAELLKKEKYCRAVWWTIFLSKKWEYKVRYEHYSKIKNPLVAEILLKMLLKEVNDNFLMDKIKESLDEISKRENQSFPREVKTEI